MGQSELRKQECTDVVYAILQNNVDKDGELHD